MKGGGFIVWFSGETALPNIVIAIAAVVVVAAIAAVLVLLASRARLRARLDNVQQDAQERELSLAEQGARLRMVGELHEVAIHSVSGIVSQADGARYKAESDTAAAARAAAAIADTARSALVELRRVMAIVRQGEADAARPPGIKTARELFRVMREAGLDIRFEETGERFPLKHGAEVAVFRILQESLSNSLKYGGEGTEVRVSFRWSSDGLTVLVDDDGIRSAARRAGGDPNRTVRDYSIEDDAAALTSSATGPGITEMRERTELFGGAFNAYTVPGVGFSVSAAFPGLRNAKGIGEAERN